MVAFFVQTRWNEICAEDSRRCFRFTDLIRFLLTFHFLNNQRLPFLQVFRLQVWTLFSSDSPSNIYMFERSCSGVCQPGCVEISDMGHRFTSCSTCCSSNFCNVGSSCSFHFSLPFIVCLSLLLLPIKRWWQLGLWRTSSFENEAYLPSSRSLFPSFPDTTRECLRWRDADTRESLSCLSPAHF